MKKCRICKYKTDNYKKINNTKIFLCTDGCKITYVLRRFLDKGYKYNDHHGYVSLSLN